MRASPAKPAVVLLSGGLDSATVLAVALAEGFAVHAVSFAYGLRHGVELEAAKRIAARAGVSHRIISIDTQAFSGSALTDAAIAVPKARSDEEIAIGIPITYVPARNTVFLSFALALAEALGAHDIFIGVNALDYSGYPDCRPEFIQAFEVMANLATACGVGGARIRIRAPLIHMTKAEIIRAGVALGVDYALTTSCYDPDPAGRACGAGDSCALRRKGFAEAGVEDPTVYS